MELKHLNLKMKKLWFIIGLCFFLLFAVLYTLLICFTDGIAQLCIICIGGTLLLLSIFTNLVYPLLKYKFYRYGYNEKRIEIEYGVIFRHHIVIPVCQIQDLHTYQGPLLIMTRLSGIIFSTAGSNFSLPGLSVEDANKMVNDIESFLNKRLEELKNEEVL